MRTVTLAAALLFCLPVVAQTSLPPQWGTSSNAAPTRKTKSGDQTAPADAKPRIKLKPSRGMVTQPAAVPAPAVETPRPSATPQPAAPAVAAPFVPAAPLPPPPAQAAAPAQSAAAPAPHSARRHHSKPVAKAANANYSIPARAAPVAAAPAPTAAPAPPVAAASSPRLPAAAVAPEPVAISPPAPAPAHASASASAPAAESPAAPPPARAEPAVALVPHSGRHHRGKAAAKTAATDYSTPAVAARSTPAAPVSSAAPVASYPPVSPVPAAAPAPAPANYTPQPAENYPAAAPAAPAPGYPAQPVAVAPLPGYSAPAASYAPAPPAPVAAPAPLPSLVEMSSKARRKAAARAAAHVASGGWIDISAPLSIGVTPNFPGIAPLQLRFDYDMDRGAPLDLSEFSMSTHTGTHVDAPLHFIRGAAAIDQVPLDHLIGPALVINMDPGVIAITAADLNRYPWHGAHRILFRTRNSVNEWMLDPQFHPDYTFLAPDAAQLLADNGVLLVGIDYLSVEQYGAPARTHMILLNHGVAIVEGLDLRAVAEGDYDLSVLPLKILGHEAAPARAVLRRR